VFHDTVTIDVPSGKGTIIVSGRGVLAADVNIQWWSTRIQNLNNSLGYNDPTHLALYLTQDTVNFIGTNPLNCCVIGFHGEAEGRRSPRQEMFSGCCPDFAAIWLRCWSRVRPASSKAHRRKNRGTVPYAIPRNCRTSNAGLRDRQK